MQKTQGNRTPQPFPVTTRYTPLHSHSSHRSQSWQQKPGFPAGPFGSVAPLSSHMPFCTSAWKRHPADGPLSHPIARAEVRPPPINSWQRHGWYSSSSEHAIWSSVVVQLPHPNRRKRFPARPNASFAS